MSKPARNLATWQHRYAELWRHYIPASMQAEIAAHRAHSGKENT